MPTFLAKLALCAAIAMRIFCFFDLLGIARASDAQVHDSYAQEKPRRRASRVPAYGHPASGHCEPRSACDRSAERSDRRVAADPDHSWAVEMA